MVGAWSAHGVGRLAAPTHDRCLARGRPRTTRHAAPWRCTRRRRCGARISPSNSRSLSLICSA
jgi:hypothetical protein